LLELDFPVVGIARDAESFTPPGLGNKRAIGAEERAVEVLTISPPTFFPAIRTDRLSRTSHVAIRVWPGRFRKTTGTEVNDCRRSSSQRCRRWEL